MSQIQRPNELTVGHCIAFLYIQLASWDGEQTKTEIATVVIKLHEWYPNGGDPKQVCLESLEWVQSCDSVGGNATYEELDFAAGIINQKMNTDAKRAILNDLKSIAFADGEVMQNEASFYNQTAKAFGFELN